MYSVAFKVLCTTMGREDMLSDPRYADFRTRAKYKAELNAEISKWTVEHGKEERVLACQVAIDLLSHSLHPFQDILFRDGDGEFFV